MSETPPGLAAIYIPGDRIHTQYHPQQQQQQPTTKNSHPAMARGQQEERGREREVQNSLEGMDAHKTRFKKDAKRGIQSLRRGVPEDDDTGTASCSNQVVHAWQNTYTLFHMTSTDTPLPGPPCSTDFLWGQSACGMHSVADFLCKGIGFVPPPDTPLLDPHSQKAAPQEGLEEWKIHHVLQDIRGALPLHIVHFLLGHPRQQPRPHTTEPPRKQSLSPTPALK